MLKAIILIGGPSKGTRFRLLSLDVLKPFFTVAGLPVVQHHTDACYLLGQERYLSRLIIATLAYIVLLKFFCWSIMAMTNLLTSYSYSKLPIIVDYGEQIQAFFVMNGDVCADFPLNEMLDMHFNSHRHQSLYQLNQPVLNTIIVTETTRQQSVPYGNAQYCWQMCESRKVGTWCCVEGSAACSDPNPNVAYAKMTPQLPLFNALDSLLNPSISILGCGVNVESEVLFNSIVLPDADQKLQK